MVGETKRLALLPFPPAGPAQEVGWTFAEARLLCREKARGILSREESESWPDWSSLRLSETQGG